VGTLTCFTFTLAISHMLTQCKILLEKELEDLHFGDSYLFYLYPSYNSHAHSMQGYVGKGAANMFSVWKPYNP
jgi:hypothetical protein